MTRPKFSGVIGLDPAWAKPSVAAWVGRDGRWAWVEYACDDRDGWAFAFGTAGGVGCKRVVIEEPYLGANPRTFGQLVTAVAKLEGYAVEAGLEVVRANTKAWMKAMLTINGHCPTLRKELLERMVYVARLLGADLKANQDDRASAVCLAEYGASLGRLKA